jgi:hypothetical protein
MGEVIRFIPKSERERIRMIREARAMYDSIFPTVDPAGERQDNASASHVFSGGGSYCNDGVLLS